MKTYLRRFIYKDLSKKIYLQRSIAKELLQIIVLDLVLAIPTQGCQLRAASPCEDLLCRTVIELKQHCQDPKVTESIVTYKAQLENYQLSCLSL